MRSEHRGGGRGGRAARRRIAAGDGAAPAEVNGRGLGAGGDRRAAQVRLRVKEDAGGRSR